MVKLDIKFVFHVFKVKVFLTLQKDGKTGHQVWSSCL
jgi:hypothetical protein